MAGMMIEGLAALVDRYDTFLLDQFGVIHDGRQPLFDSIACLDALAQRGKRIVVLSNSPTRASANKARLDTMGFPDVFSSIWTSGECAFELFRDQHPLVAGLGNKCFAFVTYAQSPFTVDLSSTITHTSLEECDFVLLCGSRLTYTHEGLKALSGMEELYALLEQAAARQLPLVCCNPDFVVVSPGKDLAIMPGTIAKKYEEEMGGRAIYIGKPHAEMYSLSLRDLPGRVLAVGDSMYHDIRGASRAGIDSLLITSGVHGPEIGQLGLEPFLAKWDVRPTFVLDQMRW